MLDLRLIRAEVLKLRRRRGMLALAAALTVGIVLLVFTVQAVQHGGDPAKYGPAGGLKNYQNAIGFMVMMVSIAGVIVGSTAGAQDIESGVFRDLAATGSSRVALFASRIAGALAIVLTIVLATAALIAAGAFGLADGLPTPDTAAIIAGTSALVAAASLSVVISVALTALVGSRGPAIGVLLAFNLALTPALTSLKMLGDVRDALPRVGLDRIAHSHSPVQVGLATAIIVLIGWVTVAFAAGAWKTSTREI
jgi:ABC-type transport system involved in multi-copper enzyme maturation permease subunit